MADTKKLSLTTPDLVVLSLLSERPMHGYEINLELEMRDVQDWAGVSRPQVYYSLNKLKLLKMISILAGKSAGEGPDRQVYKVLQKGKQALTRALAEPHWAMHRPISAFLTWLALSVHAVKADVREMLQQRKAFLIQQIEREQLTLKSFSSDIGAGMTAGILMVELTIKQFEVELEWLEKVEFKMLNPGSKKMLSAAHPA